jgi:hypothetical protein
MGRSNAMHKPGETAPEAGAYYCYICSLQGETSTCQVERGQMFVECPKCLERKVPEWDMIWMSEKTRSSKARVKTGSPWPGSLSGTR